MKHQGTQRGGSAATRRPGGRAATRRPASTVAARQRQARNVLWLVAAVGCVAFAVVAVLIRPSSPVRTVRVADEARAASGALSGGPGGPMAAGPGGSISAGPGATGSQGLAGSQGTAGSQGAAGGQGSGRSQGAGGSFSNAAATSENWSGYTEAGTPGTFTSVSSSWTEPTVTCTAQQTFSSFWVGLDGDGTQSVEQTGTEADCNNGVATYQGWFELFPNAPVFYNNPVAPGDTMSASVVANRGTAFTLTLSDQTQGWTQSTDQTSATVQLGSAEIIAEAPSGTNGVLPLSNFGTVNFANAMINNTALAAASSTGLTMVSAAGITEATPSAVTNGDDFSVTWDSNGAASSPAAPTATPALTDSPTSTASLAPTVTIGTGGWHHHHSGY